MPAPGASLKGVQAYLGRWGLAQPQPTRYTSCSSSRYTVQTGEKRTSDPAALLLPRPLQMCGSDEAPAHSPVLQDPPHWH